MAKHDKYIGELLCGHKRKHQAKGLCSSCYTLSIRDSSLVWEGNLKRQYGISAEEYYEILKTQNYVCAICKHPERNLDKRTGQPRRLAVDHCHGSGKVRGLLCQRCNQGLGNFLDNEKSLQNAITYLRGHK